MLEQLSLSFYSHQAVLRCSDLRLQSLFIANKSDVLWFIYSAIRHSDYTDRTVYPLLSCGLYKLILSAGSVGHIIR